MNKALVKPIIIDIRKPIYGKAVLSRDDKGVITNEGQEVSFIDVNDFKKTIISIREQGFQIVTVKEYGSFSGKEDKEVKKLVDDTIKEIFTAEKDPNAKLGEILEEQKKENEELKAQIAEMQEQINVILQVKEEEKEPKK